MIYDEANIKLNEFMGWKPEQWYIDHYIPPFNYFANTSEAHEAMEKLERSAALRGISVESKYVYNGQDLFGEAYISDNMPTFKAKQKSHAIAMALAEALKYLNVINKGNF